MVEYDSTTNITVGGAQVVIAGSKAKDVENKGTTDGNIGDKDKVMQFAEKYFSDLKNYGVSNDFGQPATKWTLKAEKIGTYDNTADQVYHGKVELGDIYSDLNMSTKDSAEYYVDGATPTKVDVSKGNEDEVGVGNGAVTYVYHNDDTNDVTICTVNTYVGSVSKSVAATKSKDAYIVVENESTTAPANYQKEFETDEKFEDDAIVLYTFSVSAKEIKSVKVAEKVSGELTKIVATKSYNLDDTTYKISEQIGYDSGVTMTTKSTYDFYLDNDGHVIYVEEKEFVSDDYALVLAIENEAAGSFTSNRVKLLKADGTVKTYDTDKNYTATIAVGDIVTWRYDEKADEVTLKEVAGGHDAAGTYRLGKTTSGTTNSTTTFKMENSKAQIAVAAGDIIYANSKTVFVVKNSDGDYTVYTGIKNAPGIDANSKAVYAAYYCKTDKMATVMFIDASDPDVLITSNSSKAIYLAGESKSKLITDKNANVDYYEFNAVVDGEVKTVKVRSDVNLDTNAEAILTGVADSTAKNYLYGGATYNADGIITGFSANTNTKGTGTKTDKLSGEYNVKLDTTSWTVAEDAKIWTIDEKGKISAGTIKSVKKDDNDTFIYTAKDGEITNLFVQEVKDGTAPVVTENVTYSVGLLGCSKDSKNVQFMVGKYVDGTFVKWLSADELKALNLTTNDVIVNNAGKPVALSTDGTGTYYKKFGGVYAAAAWDFSDSPIAIFGIDAYDGNPATGAASMYGANAGFVKAHLATALVAGSLTVYVDGENFTAFQTNTLS